MPFKHFYRIGILFVLATLVQGCMVLAWLGIICTDISRCSDVEFESFENVQVATADRQQPNSLRRIAVAPFAGDPNLAEWWADVLHLATDCDILHPAEITGRLSPSVVTQLAQSAAVQVDTDLVTWISRDLNIDGIFIGRISGDRKEPDFWGMKERYEKTLHLTFVNSEGTLVWKADLPFVVIKGKKDIDKGIAKRTLLTHVTTHEKELRWRELGLLK